MAASNTRSISIIYVTGKRSYETGSRFLSYQVIPYVNMYVTSGTLCKKESLVDLPANNLEDAQSDLELHRLLTSWGLIVA